MKNKISLFIHFALSFVYCNAQDLPNIIPPSPNAASLGNYGEVPVGLFTGTPQISIPLYDFKTGKINVPISLSYSSNGIRVDEMASDVGLGWVLNSGGVITRTIMDDGDENITPAVPNFSNYNEETLAYLRNATNPNDGFDTMADLYSFNFNGFSGTFYLDENKNPVLTKPSPIKIVNTPFGTYAFKITDPNGVIYWFGDADSTEKTMCRSKLAGHNTWTGEEASSWYLSKIENPNSGDVVTFNYEDSNYSYDAGLSQTVTRGPSSGGSYAGQNLVITESRVLGVSLSSITSNSGKISFIYSVRDNISNTKKVESVEIEDFVGNKIKKFVLGYDIITSSLVNEYKNPHIPYELQYGQRLFLSSITEVNNGKSNPPYKFAYYDYDKIPPRFSYVQDYWGYFNGAVGNSYLVSNDDYFFVGNTFSPSVLKNLFSNVGGNKKPSGLYSKNGLLKIITYPTGGYNELTYEPHSYYGTRLNYGNKKGYTISISNTDIQHARSETVTTEKIPYDQERTPLYFSAGTTTCWEEDSWPSDLIRATLTAEVADEGSDVFKIPAANEGFYSISVNGNFIYDISSSLPSGLTGQRYINLKKGKRYRFKVSVPFECVRGDFSTSFYEQAPITENINTEVGGQRLARIKAVANDGKQEIKDYYYGTLSCLTCSSGIVEAPIPSITLKTFHDFSGSSFSGDSNYSFKVSDILSLSSSTLYSLYTKQNSHIGYTSVIESIGENFGAGGISHKFIIAPVENAVRLQGYYVPGTPLSTTFNTGDEIETQYFLKNEGAYTTTKKISNYYAVNPVLNKERYGYNINQRDMFSGGTWTYEDKIRGYDITKYTMRSRWYYLKMTTEEIYDLNGSNPVITTNNYNYNNQTHLQLSSQTTINSKGETFETKYFYPTDIEVSGLPFVSEMITKNMIGIPLRTQKYNGVAKLSEQVSVYDKSSATSNLLLPRYVYSNKGADEINVNLDKKITYDQYDDKGNIVQYSLENGMPVSIIWGYNKTQPIAKVENASYSEITSYVQNLQSLSDTGTEINLISALNTMRNDLVNAMITTYTHIPLVGISTITDPKGDKITYTYDSLGRLEFVKDKDQNILSENQYNYKQ
ncbi:hypothetical protein [Flavobacterium reichenbachii]|uniref:Sugar-binding protein n=1 Tax=Flavobacterium reichenbachii TaxID=362418 RepID=A0A085ZDV6_9FLAO|nr:hypothetical protein [Flavobacterium reichenbachii]KFF02620.1 hypothetical protein IW19_23420 [Flavobacterium reichenbachii]OXB11115.1 hypothetical protein B0A68_21050 [Flavobacterium reichenbachii]